MRKLVSLFVALALVAALAPAAVAKTKKVKSNLQVDVVGLIDRHATVTYAFIGELRTGFSTAGFSCVNGRKVTLFRLAPDGSGTPVASDKTDFLGGFAGALEMPIAQVPGSYYAEVGTKKKKSRGKKLKCLDAQTDPILVEVPSGLL